MYHGITSIYHYLFKVGIRKSSVFDIPVIGVGNIAVGGSGKTPLVEYLLRTFKSQMPIATLSRGYKRQRKGFRYAGPKDTASTIGDESFQVYRKFQPEVMVAVCKNRAQGIARITDDHPHIKLVVLDDAFQHRRVRSSCAIVLSDYSTPFYEDYLIPVGRLRESRHGSSRAHIVIISKCPQDLSSEQKKEIEKKVRHYTKAPVFFSSYQYGSPISFEGSKKITSPSVLLTSGLAAPQSFYSYAKQQYVVVKIFDFPDHHNYTEADVKKIESTATSLQAVILTTEKDYVKLRDPRLAHVLHPNIWFYVPIQMVFLERESHFLNLLQDFIKPIKSV